MQNKNSKRIEEKGFVILFAVTVSAILLGIALGVSNIALKEIKFGTSAKDTNNAFFAADTGIEKILFNDKSQPDGSASNLCPPSAGGVSICDYVFPALGPTNTGCAKVNVKKDNGPTYSPSIHTDIISKGYNLGGEAGGCTPPTNSIEREITTSY